MDNDHLPGCRSDGAGHCRSAGVRKGWFEVAALPALSEPSGPGNWDNWRSVAENPGKSATWVTNGRIRKVELSGRADAGGYCYAWICCGAVFL